MITYTSFVFMLTKSWTYVCIFFTYQTCVTLELVSVMTVLENKMVRLENLIRIIFEELDPVWRVGWRCGHPSLYD
jgi:hypothetical protein